MTQTKLFHLRIIVASQVVWLSNLPQFSDLGQPHLRSEDRYRHITNDRARVPSVYPIKHKRSHDRGLTLEERLVKQQ